MTVKFDAKAIPNGMLLLLGVSYDGMGQTNLDTTRGRQTPKVFTYALLKAGGLWYMTGSGQAPHAAGWPVVERWLSKQGRRLEWIKGVHEADLDVLWTAPAAAIEGPKQGRDLTAPHPMDSFPVVRRDNDHLSRPTGADQ